MYGRIGCMEVRHPCYCLCLGGGGKTPQGGVKNHWSGSSVSFPSGVRGEARPHTNFGVFWAWKSQSPVGNIFYKRPKMKHLYRQKVPEGRSKIYTNKNFRGEFPHPRLFFYVWKKHCTAPMNMLPTHCCHSTSNFISSSANRTIAVCREVRRRTIYYTTLWVGPYASTLSEFLK